MNHTSLKKHLAAIMLGVSVIVAPGYALAQTTTDECTKELLLSYFPESFVKNTLQKFNVPKDKWDAIVKALAEKDKEVLKMVEDKASKLNPNPFKDRDPAQRQVAVKIFRETLFQVFSDSLKSQGVDTNLQAMLDDIQQQKAKNFAQCMEKQKSQTPGGQAQPAAPAEMTPAAPAPAETPSAPESTEAEPSSQNPMED